MNYKAIEFKLAQYVQWCGNPLRALGHRRQSIIWRHQAQESNPDALPELSDAEAQTISEALLMLKQLHRQAYEVIHARFWKDWSDEKIGRRLRLGGRSRVQQLRLQAYSSLGMYFMKRDLSLERSQRPAKRRPNPRQLELPF